MNIGISFNVYSHQRYSFASPLYSSPTCTYTHSHIHTLSHLYCINPVHKWSLSNYIPPFFSPEGSSPQRINTHSSIYRQIINQQCFCLSFSIFCTLLKVHCKVEWSIFWLLRISIFGISNKCLCYFRTFSLCFLSNCCQFFFLSRSILFSDKFLSTNYFSSIWYCYSYNGSSTGESSCRRWQFMTMPILECERQILSSSLSHLLCSLVSYWPRLDFVFYVTIFSLTHFLLSQSLILQSPCLTLIVSGSHWERI